MSDPSQDEVLTRLDDLLKEVRRQGRAAVAAQAAAESCLDAVQQQRSTGAVDDEDAGEPEPSREPERWLRALIPVADSIDRIVAQSAALAEPRARPPRSLLQRFFDEPADDRRPLALLEGLRVLQSQLAAAFAELGVTVDRRLGAPVDAERQRVVEVRSPRGAEQAGTVVEVVRPGYALGELTVREAEVVVSREGPASEG
jgi:hypothetical protein